MTSYLVPLSIRESISIFGAVFLIFEDIVKTMDKMCAKLNSFEVLMPFTSKRDKMSLALL